MKIDILKLWLALLRMPNLGVLRIYELYKAFPELNEFFATSAGWRAKQKLPEQLIVDEAGIEKDLAWLNASANNTILTLQDEAYPALLKEINTAPPLLFIKGNVELLGLQQIAMVGSRNPTHYGKEIANKFAKELANYHFVITSGLALGIDAVSHKGALQVKGKTLAVMGASLEQIYPKTHQSLAIEIIEKGGALVSEFPIGTPPLPENFPRRNRIISGLSKGVVVIEAALRSGSLITAHLANEQGREVFAVPGSIHNPVSRGCHALIKQGAKLVECVEDIIEEIAPFLLNEDAHKADTDCQEENSQQGRPGNTLASKTQKLLNCVQFEPITVDELLARSGLTVQEITQMLSNLEMQGDILATTRGYVRAKL